MGLELFVVSSIHWICSGQDRGSGIKGGCDTGLSNGNSLLLHDLMDVGSISFVHLVELIDTANTCVGKDQGTTFENNLTSVWVLKDGSGQTDSRRTFTSCVDTSWCKTRNMLEKLGFGNTWISHEKSVNVASDSHAVLHLFGYTSNHGQKEALLNLSHSENFWADTPRHGLEQFSLVIIRIFDLVNLVHHFVSEHIFSEILSIFGDFISLDMGVVNKRISHCGESCQS